MVTAGIILVIIANLFIYIRKVILRKHGIKTWWFGCWKDSSLFHDIILDKVEEEKKLIYHLFNIAPFVFFIIGAILFFYGVSK